MKLYATVASERASKGQGGNKFLDVAVLVGDARTQREVIRIKAKTFLDQNGIESYAILGSWHGATEQEKVLHTGTLKGERQKGEFQEGWHTCEVCGRENKIMRDKNDEIILEDCKHCGGYSPE